MKAIIKKSFAVLMAIIICFSAFVPTFAMEANIAQEEEASESFGDKILDFLWSIVSRIQDLWYSDWNLIYRAYKNSEAATPAVNTVDALPEYESAKSADFYVSPDGDYSIKNIKKLQKKVPGFEEIPVDEIGIKLP